MNLASKPTTNVAFDRIILHFDYDCFYASVFEVENPKLKSLPLAVQQKQIIVTCNYEARRRGLYKLQLVSEARRLCPQVIIVLGEDLTRFRDASKELHRFLTSCTWNGRCERLGFDEAWLDCTDIVEYNIRLLDLRSLEDSFFQIDRNDPEAGFPYDASAVVGHMFPEIEGVCPPVSRTHKPFCDNSELLAIRLRLSSHLASFIREKLEREKGYTATVGISVNKLLAKLVGNLHKPNSQTTLLPPYNVGKFGERSNVLDFLDTFPINRLPGIGFKMSVKLSELVLGRAISTATGVTYGPLTETISVSDLRKHPKTSIGALDDVLGGIGLPKDIGRKVFDLIHGRDSNEVSMAKSVPQQISIEDSYLCLDTYEDVCRELLKLSKSLLKRMRLDLTEAWPTETLESKCDMHIQPQRRRRGSPQPSEKIRWLAIPRTLRLSTRPRPPPNSDGFRSRSFKRISRSCPLPSYVFGSEPIERLASTLVTCNILPMFESLHPGKSGWNLSLINLAVTQVELMAGQHRAARGRDISEMLRLQTSITTLNSFQSHPEQALSSALPEHRGPLPVSELSQALRNEDKNPKPVGYVNGSEDQLSSTQGSSQVEDNWDSEEDATLSSNICSLCGARMPNFALDAHSRFHLNPE